MILGKRANNFDNKTGRRYGQLTVLELYEIETLKSGKKRTVWLCQCDCGNKCKIRGNYLSCNITKSCGCLALKKMNDFIQNIVKKPPGIRCRNQVFSSYKVGSKKRGLEFNLSLDDFLKITKQNCHYCNDPPCNVKKSEYGNGEFIYNGIDRVDNSKGYILENCVPCCYDCNFMKKTLSINEFLNKAIKIANNWKEKAGKNEK